MNKQKKIYMPSLPQCNLAFQFYTISCTFIHINVVDAQSDLSLLSVKNHRSIIHIITLEFFLYSLEKKKIQLNIPNKKRNAPVRFSH